jgi:hypothetical protein
LPHTQAVAERLANLRLGPAAALGTASTEAIKTEPRAVAHTNLLEEFTLAGKAKSEAPPDQESLSDDNDSLSEEKDDDVIHPMSVHPPPPTTIPFLSFFHSFFRVYRESVCVCLVATC